MARPGRLVRRSAALGLVLVAVAGCGPADDAAVVRQTAAKMDDITSGVVTIKATATPAGDATDATDGAGQKAGPGFELSGPFSFVSLGPLPAFDIDFNATGGGERAAGGLVSTGQKAYVEKAGIFYELPAEELERLRIDAARPPTTGFGQLHMETWLKNPKVSEGDPVGGVSTDRIRGEVDVAAVVNDLLALARGLGLPAGVGPGTISPEDTAQLNRLAKAASVEILTGAGDRLMRRLTLDVTFTGEAAVDGAIGGGPVDGGDPLASAITALAGRHITIDLRLDDPNKEVTVAEPAEARPFSELPES